MKQFKVYITRDSEQMSDVASDIMIGKIAGFVPNEKKPYLSFILPTGNTPTGTYKRMIEKQGNLDLSGVVSHNLDEYVGLPGGNVTERVMHPEGYGFFMTHQLFGNLKKPFHRWHVPRGCEIDQGKLEEELAKYEGNDYYFEGGSGEENGRAIIIPENSKSDYLKWIKNEILDFYVKSIRKYGKVDLALVGVGGEGHIAFHESLIPLNLEMLLVELSKNTVDNAVEDGHFDSVENSPKYAVSLGAGFVFNPEYNSEVLLIANGERKRGPVGGALLEDVNCEVPISGCQEFAKSGKVIWVVDYEAGKDVLDNKKIVEDKGIEVCDLRC